MRNSRKLFIATEAVLAVLVLLLAFSMVREKHGERPEKISVIVEDSDGSQWTSFKYGLKMAAEDQNVEMNLVSTEENLTWEQQQALIEQELENGARGILIQPAAGAQELIKSTEKKCPVLLVEERQAAQESQAGPPSVLLDHDGMGAALARELKEDYGEGLAEKSLGLFSWRGESEAAKERRSGFLKEMEDTGCKVSWELSGPGEEGKGKPWELQKKVDFVIALDDRSLVEAGESAAAGELHGAVIYGIGNSTEAVYYLDTGLAECLVTPDAFSMGYRSLEEMAMRLHSSFYNMRDEEVSYTVLRKEVLFSEENQDLLFTMSQ